MTSLRNRLWRIFHIHDWTMWKTRKEYTDTRTGYPIFEQLRMCAICGKIEVRYVSHLTSKN